MKFILSQIILTTLASVLRAGEAEPALQPAPTVDRVEFPKAYGEQFQVLRMVEKPKELKVVTIYGNKAAASVTNTSQLPYPYGSVIVMETASLLKNSEGRAVQDTLGHPQKDKVTGLHVMRREKDFGMAYGKNRAAEWEFVEYRPDGTYITPPEKSAACAECHVKAGAERDYVYRGRFPEETKK